MLKVACCLLVFLVGAYIGYVDGALFWQKGCNYQGVTVKEGETYLSPITCDRCSCHNDLLRCASPMRITRHPENCKVVRDPITCEVRVVKTSNEEELCDGPIAGVGRR